MKLLENSITPMIPVTTNFFILAIFRNTKSKIFLLYVVVATNDVIRGFRRSEATLTNVPQTAGEQDVNNN
jgi:hypothetical protein